MNFSEFMKTEEEFNVCQGWLALSHHEYLPVIISSETRRLRANSSHFSTAKSAPIQLVRFPELA